MLKFFSLLLLASGISFNMFAQVKTPINGAEQTVYPLMLQQPDDFSDLRPFKEILSSKKMVGMGEATHGTKEFFELKSKMFRFLVTECNYKVFGIEASYGGCSYINDYISSGKGSIDSVMFYFDFWTWRTQEVKELIVWMKNYNEGKAEADKIVFYGFDMQNFYSPLQYMSDFFKRDQPAKFEELKQVTHLVTGRSEQQIYVSMRSDKQKISDTLTRVYDSLKSWLHRNSAYIESAYSAKQLQRLLFCAENYGQAVKNITADFYFRDSCMAANAAALQKLEQGKMFVWAHNYHISNAFRENYTRVFRLPMGGYLKEKLGTDYYSIGFVFNSGSFQAIQGPRSMAAALFTYAFARKKMYKGLMECSVPVNKKNTLPVSLSKAGISSFFMNMQGVNESTFSSTQKMYDMGAVFMNYKRCSEEVIANKQFDGLIFVEKTTRAIPVK